MKCEHIQSLLMDYLDDQLPNSQTELVEIHLTECKSCREEFHQNQKLFKALENLKDEIPDPGLKENFYQMLEEEKKFHKPHKLESKSGFNKPKWGNFGEFLKYAAAIVIIFGVGVLMGKTIGKDNSSSVEIVKLQTELQLMQQNLTLATLRQPTTSQRLNAVNLIDEKDLVDDRMLSILIQTLHSDENVNVRMAAANALSKYTQNELVRNALLEALKNQKDPSLQITLINLLVKMQDERAKSLFKEIMENENTLPVVKQLAGEGIKVFA